MKTALYVAVLLGATSLAAQGPAARPSADELAATAKQLEKSGDLPAATTSFCQAAAQDQKYRKQCSKAQEEFDKALAHFQADLDKARAEIGRKDYASATADLGKITFGPNKDVALDLINRIRIAPRSSAPDPASRAALQEAHTAYLNGDFDRVEAFLKYVQTPDTQDAANQLRTDIRMYRDTMRQAAALAQAGYYKDAASKYKFAALIQPRGPGQPQEHQREAEKASATADALKLQQQPANQPAQTLPPPAALAKALARPGSPPSDAPSEKKRALAAAARDDLPPMQEQLLQAITDFYASRFAIADAGLHLYLQASGVKHQGAAHFFLGASLLSQAMLADPRNRPAIDALQQQGLQQFSLARQMHYTPIQTSVSPRILAQWSQPGVAK